MDGPRELARRFFRAAPRLERTGFTVELAGTIEQRGSIVDKLAGGAQQLARRTDIDVAFIVIGKILAREGSIVAPGFIEDGNVRFDPLLMD